MIYTSSSLKAIIFNLDPGLSFSLIFLGWIFPMNLMLRQRETFAMFMLYDNCLLAEPNGSNEGIFSFSKEA